MLVSGSGTNLQALIDDGLPITAVASNVPGVHALTRAQAAGIPTAVFDLRDFPSRTERDHALASWLEGHGVLVVVCAGYMHLLTGGFLGRFPARVVNVHPSLLPAFPGPRAVADVLAAGASETGVTVHIVDEGVDTGPVLAQERVRVEPDDTQQTLHERIHEVEHRLLPRVVRTFVAARLSEGEAS